MSVERYSEGRSPARRHWRDQAVEARPSNNIVSQRTSAIEAEAAWVADYRVRNAAAITKSAGEGLGHVHEAFDELNDTYEGIGPGLAAFESAYISGASQLIARYPLGR